MDNAVITQYYGRFNTQPPEGGWLLRRRHFALKDGFNTQPPEGGWFFALWRAMFSASFNTQPPEGGWASRKIIFKENIMFQHTAARRRLDQADNFQLTLQQFQHTAARRRLATKSPNASSPYAFQHTAARRRLVGISVRQR